MVTETFQLWGYFMKKFLVVSLAAFAVLFILSCGSDKKGEEKEENKNDVSEQNDSDVTDTGETSSDNSSEKPDNADETDNDATVDTGDTGSDDDTSSDDADTVADNDDPSDDSGDPQPDSDVDEDTGQDPDTEFTVNENLQPVPPEQNNNTGDECDDDTFVEFCDGEVVVFCRDSRVARSSCGAGEACIATVGLYDDYGNRNYADCYEKCGTAGEKSTTCKQNRYYSDDNSKTLTIGTLKHDLCMKTSKGNLLFEDTNRTTEEICDSPCKDSTSCAGLAEIPADQKNGTNAECDPDTFKEFCEGNTSVFCYAGRVTRTNCSATNNTCLTVSGIFGTNQDKNSSSCRNSCDGNEPASQTCGIVSINNQSQYATTYDFCVPTSKGSLEFVALGEKCTSGCSSDGKTCR